MTRVAAGDAAKTRLVLLVALLVLVALGVAAWWFVLRDDAEPVATLGDCSAVDGGPTSPTGSWGVSPDGGGASFVGYRVDERFGGATIEKAATGRTGQVEGSMVVTDDAVTEASVVAHVDSLESNRTARDTAIHTKGLETDTFPTATFTLTEPIALDSPARGEPVHGAATGTLALHGETNEVEVSIDACWTGPTIRLSGRAPILFSDYGIEAIHTPIVDIADHGELELSLIFVPA